jgi:chromosome segregation ATPase
MGIFGFLSKSHVEHSASVDREQAIVAQIESKIEREKSLILRLENKLSKLESQQGSSTDVKDETLIRLESRITQIKEESETSLARQRELIESYQLRLKELDEVLDSSKESGLFASNKKYKELSESQKEERDLLSKRKLESESKIQLIIDKTDEDISKTREQIDTISLQKDEVIVSTDNTEIENIRTEVESSYNKIDDFETEKFDYGAKLRALEVEIGPVKYIASVLQDWVGLQVDISEAVRIVIVILIFVFDPLAILLLIAATITYSSMKEKELPADVKEIRNKLLEELEEYLDEGGIADHFIDRQKK